MIMLIPNVADAYANNNFAMLRNLLQQSMWFTMMYGVPAVVFMYIFAEPLTALFFFLGSIPLLEIIVALFLVSLLRDTYASLSNWVRISERCFLSYRLVPYYLFFVDVFLRLANIIKYVRDYFGYEYVELSY